MRRGMGEKRYDGGRDRKRRRVGEGARRGGGGWQGRKGDFFLKRKRLGYYELIIHLSRHGKERGLISVVDAILAYGFCTSYLHVDN